MNTQWNKIEPTNELDKKLYDKFTNLLRHGYVEIGEDKTVMSMHFVDIIDKLDNFQVRNSDVIVASYPKTGSTWCEEMVWMIVNNLDFEGGKQIIEDRFPFLEYERVGIFNFEKAVKLDPSFQLLPFMCDSVKHAEEQKGAIRFIKTHLPWNFLPKQIKNNEKTPKIIYITRNTKDMFVSYYYHSILIEGYNGDFDTFCELFLADRLNYGNYYNHIQGYWRQKHLPNIMFVKYEDMKQNMSSVIKKVSSFLNKSLSEQQISDLCEHLSFETMKNSPAVNTIPDITKFYENKGHDIKFMRCGTIGSYKKDLSGEMEKKFDKWIEENIKRTGITFIDTANNSIN